MRTTLFLILACGLAIAQADTWRQSEDNSSDEDHVSQKWIHRHSNQWPSELANYPEAHVLIHKVEKRLERVHGIDEHMKSQVFRYVTDQLKHCKSSDRMDEHCVKRSIGHAMSFINNYEEQRMEI